MYDMYVIEMALLVHVGNKECLTSTNRKSSSVKKIYMYQSNKQVRYPSFREGRYVLTVCLISQMMSGSLLHANNSRSESAMSPEGRGIMT